MKMSAGDDGVCVGRFSVSFSSLSDRMLQPYFQNERVTIYHADCREVLPLLTAAGVIITDPVWPNCPAGLLIGWNNPEGVFRGMIESLPELPKRMVVVMRSDSDPRFLKVVPTALPFFRCQILPYVIPSYSGRKLIGDELAYCFGEPIPSAPGAQLIQVWRPGFNLTDAPLMAIPAADRWLISNGCANGGRCPVRP